jgi:hypothetical protein|tara:strand:+ start:758 stop:1207 length:450 start_codon:yes stop_codon:yes gene_type:complete
MSTANAATNNLEEAILTGILNQAADPLYVSLLKIQLHSGTAPDAAAIETGGTISNELATSGGYTQGGIALTTSNMEVTAAGVLQNDAELTWGVATGNWSAAVTYVVITGKLTAGGSAESLFIGALSAAKTVTTGDTFKFAVNALTITLS